MTGALIFDFDGTLVDTEAAVLTAWQEIFRERGGELPLDVWHTVIGTQNTAVAMFELLEKNDENLDRIAVRTGVRARVTALLESEGPRPGVQEYLAEAEEQGLRLAIASSSTGDWVTTQLNRLGLADAFEAVLTGDLHEAKPSPDLYLAALTALDLPASEAIAFEDSPHGVTAAKAAGLRCVAVPNAITAVLNFDHADLVLGSLADKPLSELLSR
ncbi:HAD family hydrolase [Amycolatopsis regifaucium]|uniref:HAD family hydrolase n=1 Tax=Amycolatopsis regifaucium TaxID=546365 RepID=A0A154MHE0_9PSEU|nr:HAD family hydrolase [Amycolatopsis regifaucium]KZB83796.1 HAD family hydrolase [Amycolatopsis regifaucium]OKA06763.1 HAD family hydrolase [Amycolatopsis regifaucium]SFH26240.1 haloacid dehalogenase superfamily, subfamily IA, variant 3 with third motif having DD or ED [Amycolatopsis regifaucium]